MHIYRDYSTPTRSVLTYEERIEGPDRGLINAWEVGRRRARKEPKLVEQALRGELPDLGLKGGIEGMPKFRKKYGCLWYLAQWQGLRGEHLDIHLDRDVVLVCSRTKVEVTFTGAIEKYVSLQG